MTRMEVTNLEDLHEWDAERIRFALEGVNRILASPMFGAEWLQAKLTETEGLTNQQVLDKILGADALSPLDKVGVLDVDVILYRKAWSKVVGYTFFNAVTIWVNRRFFGDACSIASNLLHESTHQLGFGHARSWATTVPYQANRIVEKLWPVLCKDIDERYWKWWYS